METKAGFTLLILSVFAILLDGYGGVFLCSDLVSRDLFGGSVVIFDYGDGDGCHGDDGMEVFSFHSSIVMGILPPLFRRIYGGDRGLARQFLSNTSFDLSPFTHGGCDGIDGGGETIEIDQILNQSGKDIEVLAMTAMLGFDGDDVGGKVEAARATLLAPLGIGLEWAWAGSARVSLVWALANKVGLGPLV